MILTSTMILAQNKKITVGAIEAELNSPLENRYAFIVGIDHYRDQEISNLSSCRLDAVRFSSFLKSNANWKLPKNKIELLLDPNEKTFKESFIQLLNTIEKPDISTLYFYYSGHGIQGGIVPSDFDKTKLNHLISYDWIKEEISVRNIKAVVLVLDACYSGSIVDTKNMVPFDENYFGAFNEDNETNKHIIFTATNAYRVTSAGKHESMYSSYFLEALENSKGDIDGNGVLSSGELFNTIKNDMGSTNVPQFYGNKNFPMAAFSSGSNTVNTINADVLAKTNEPTYINSNFISWRKRLDRIKPNKELLQKMIQSLRSSDNAEASARLGYLYREGIGMRKNINLAISHFVTAAEQGNAFAQYNLGYLYANGIGFNKDEKKAIRYYRMAATKGHPFALYNMGAAFAKPEGGLCPYDFERARKWLEKAALYDIPSTYFTIGTLYSHEASQQETKEQEKRLKKEAYKWYLKAATNNHPRAQVALAVHYSERGRGRSDSLLTRHWLRKACRNNEMQACRKLIDYMDTTSLTSNQQ